MFKEDPKKGEVIINNSGPTQQIENQSFHANTIKKVYPSSKERVEYFDEDNFPHNTTGDKDRKRRKNVQTVILSGKKGLNPICENPLYPINQFCPDNNPEFDNNMNQVSRFSNRLGGEDGIDKFGAATPLFQHESND